MYIMDNVIQTALTFRTKGTPISWKNFGQGRINSTFIINTDTDQQYVLQLINKNVFQQPDKLMENTSAVTEYLRKHSDGKYTTLRYMQDKDTGKFYHIDESGDFWRLYAFVPGVGMDVMECDEDFYQCALGFGWFQNMLSDFPAHTLHETIPNFHNTPDRYEKMKRSISADVKGRVANVQKELSYLMEKEWDAGTIQRALKKGDIPLRVTHNDTKINNILIDPQTHKAVCVLDLDTVMPGSSLYDFGDAIRFGAATGGEDTVDPATMQCYLHLFEVFTRGWLEALPTLTENEIGLLPYGAWIMTLELAMRFLTDYLDGDIYFRANDPEHNLRRARNQLYLAMDMEKKLPQMRQIIRNLRRKCETV